MINLNKIKYVHILGICGTGVGSLALLLKQKGFTITGSDENIYPPMSTQLEQNDIKLLSGYSTSNLNNLSNKPDVVIIGNVISRGNPEAEAVLASGIPYLSMPQAVSEFFLKDKHSIVLAGTHGKTSSSTLCAWLLESAGKNPSFLIGGVGNNFLTSARLTDSDYFVIEGDEYDTAFFDKGPKFLHYRPQSVMLGPVEFDHADIYADLSAVLESFKKLVNIIQTEGRLLACYDSENTRSVAELAKCKMFYYGISKKAYYHPINLRTVEDGMAFDLIANNENVGALFVPFFGEHNLQNTIGVIATLLTIGIPLELIRNGLVTFKGVKRRLDIRGEAGGITVIDDFAHHPTAITETIKAVRMKYPKRRIVAIFEPRSNTSRRNIFQKEFATAFTGADLAIISGIHRADKLKEEEKLDLNLLVNEINEKSHCKALNLKNADEINEFLSKEGKSGDVILVMSNGGFDNIHEKLLRTFGGTNK